MDIIGKKIISARLATPKEKESLGMGDCEDGICIEIEGGFKLFASRDEEGNGLGCFFLLDKQGKCFSIC